MYIYVYINLETSNNGLTVMAIVKLREDDFFQSISAPFAHTKILVFASPPILSPHRLVVVNFLSVSTFK